MQPFISFSEQKSIVSFLLLDGALKNLIAYLDERIRISDSNALIDINKVISRPETISLLIKKILADQYIYEQVCKNSYYHENGFHKIVLLSGKNFKLRLHHFGVSAKIPMENIHDHRWPFASSILSGSLEMDLFKLSAESQVGEKLIHYVYNSDKSKGAYSIQKKGIVRLSVDECRKYNAGESYLMLPHELHRIKNQEGQESITLILTGKSENATCNLFAKRKFRDEEKNIAPYEQNQLRLMLESISERIFPQKN